MFPLLSYFVGLLWSGEELKRVLASACSFIILEDTRATDRPNDRRRRRPGRRGESPAWVRSCVRPRTLRYGRQRVVYFVYNMLLCSACKTRYRKLYKMSLLESFFSWNYNLAGVACKFLDVLKTVLNWFIKKLNIDLAKKPSNILQPPEPEW